MPVSTMVALDCVVDVLLQILHETIAPIGITATYFVVG